ncbi:MAG: hypothetical protein M1381_08370 [Deltaproteobacteria bacterium]|nr:hypothetical protein [Deltaproteobacteria bacterium]
MIIVKFLIERAWFKATSFLTGFTMAKRNKKSPKSIPSGNPDPVNVPDKVDSS